MFDMTLDFERTIGCSLGSMSQSVATGARLQGNLNDLNAASKHLVAVISPCGDDGNE